jgi:endonuclease YncB( thermonuclease family)
VNDRADIWRSLWEQSLVVDSETLGLARGLPVHEVGLYDVGAGTLTEFLPGPQSVMVDAGDGAQELVGLASTRHDVFTRVQHGSWPEAIAHTRADPRVDLSFLDRALAAGKHPHLQGLTEAPRRVAGMSVETRRVTMNQLLLDELPKRIAGKIVWGANIQFDASQLSAQLGAEIGTTAANPFAGTLETASERGHNFLYVTGEGARARVRAQASGDWSGIWDVYKQAPAAGETAVRDIQDLLRSLISRGRKAGIMGGQGLGGVDMDLQSRLVGSVTGGGRDALLNPELHRAVEDTVVEGNVLKNALRWHAALDTLGTAEPDRQALDELAAWGERLEATEPARQRRALASRFSRAHLDLLEQGITYQNVGIADIRQMRHVDPQGRPQMLPRAQADRAAFSNLDAVAEWLSKDGTYGAAGVDVHEEYARYLEVVGGYNDPKAGAIGAAASADTAYLRHLEDNADSLLKLSGQRRLRATMATPRAALPALGKLAMGGRGMAAAAAVGMGLAAAGVVAGPGKRHRPESQSMVASTYDQWVMARAHMAAGTKPSTHPQSPVHEGFSSRGYSAANRRARTDFGSPYAGPSVSNTAFITQELYAEREKWMRQQYQIRYHDPQTGIFGINGPFKQLLPGGYSFMTDGTPVAAGYQGIQGRSNIGIRLGGRWRLEAEDADTVVVKRGGLRGAVASMFGMNRGYSFRLAGVDSPETSHGAQSYHAPQPGAEASTAALAAIIRGSRNLELIFDPTQQTYGRMMGVVVADGRNVNFDIVRQGIAAHLPFGKSSESMLDYRGLKRMEDAAIGSRRGIWAEPWALAFADLTEAAGHRPTFNSLAKRQTLAENASKANALGFMELAQANGHYGAAEATAAAAVGHSLQMGADKAGPIMLPAKPGHWQQWHYQLQADLGRHMSRHGSALPRPLSHTQGHGTLDSYMALDSFGNSTAPSARPHTSFRKRYRVNTRRANMQDQQAVANRAMNVNPINHHRM